MEDKKEKENIRGRFATIRFFMKGSVRFFLCSVIFVCLLVVFELVNPKVIGWTVDFVTGDMSRMPQFLKDLVERLGGRSWCIEHLWVFSLIVAGIAVIGAVCRYAFRMFNGTMAETLVKRMRDTVYDQVIHLPFKWHDDNRTGDIIQRATSDVDMVRNFISEQLTSVFRMVILLVLAISMMASINGWLTLAAAAFIPVIIGYSLIFHRKIGSAFEKADTEEGKLSAIAQENISGLRVVRAFGRERYERERFEGKNETYTKLWVRTMQLLSIFWITNDIIGGLQMITVLGLGAHLAVAGAISAGEYVSFIAYNGMLIWPVRQLGRVISEMSKAGVSIDRLRYILDSKREEDAEGAVGFPDSTDIDFEKVSFSYGEGEVLKGLDLHIKAGQTIGILGGTGTGKSTMAALLDGLYELPEENGCIKVGGIDIRSIKKHELRKNIGLMLQEPYLFSRTLEENITIAAPKSTHADVEAASKGASLDTAIERFNEGYKTPVGERGVTLSGGQKQRTAIARTLIRKTPVMIFDDSLSAVDAQTDAKIRAGLAQAGQGVTVILISHRITTLMNADRIFVIEDGRVAEEGSHEELLALGGRYRRIYDLQSAFTEDEGEVAHE